MGRRPDSTQAHALWGRLARSRAGDTSQGPLRVTSHVNSHDGMFAVASFMDTLSVSKRSDGLPMSAGTLLL